MMSAHLSHDCAAIHIAPHGVKAYLNLPADSRPSTTRRNPHKCRISIQKYTGNAGLPLTTSSPAEAEHPCPSIRTPDKPTIGTKACPRLTFAFLALAPTASARIQLHPVNPPLAKTPFRYGAGRQDKSHTFQIVSTARPPSAPATRPNRTPAPPMCQPQSKPPHHIHGCTNAFAAPRRQPCNASGQLPA